MDHNASSAGHAVESGLLVEWMEGPEAREGSVPEVHVDDRAVGPVDKQIRITPGPHRVCIRHGILQTNEYFGEFRPDRLVILDYAEKSAGTTLWVFVIVIGISGAQAVWNLIDHASPLIVALAASALLAALATLVVAWPWVTRGYVVTLRPYLPNTDGIETTHDASHDHHPSAARPVRTGRLMVNLKVRPVRGVQPPRPRVLIDGKNVGNIASIFRVPAGMHNIRVRGWVDRSDELRVTVSPGGLVEIEVDQSQIGLAAMFIVGGAAAIGMATIFYSNMETWGAEVFAALVAASVVVAAVLTRFRPSMELRIKSQA